MARITIEISLRDGKLYYEDSESDKGYRIETHVKPEDEIVWIAKPGSGIEDLKKLGISGTTGFFEKEPAQVGPTQWNARVGNIKEGKVTYDVAYSADIKSDEISIKSSTKQQLYDEKSPVIMLP